MKNIKYIFAPFVIFAVLALFSCKKDELKIQERVSKNVITSSVTDITNTSATCGGNVTDDGGFTVTARGVCWSTSPNPTISDSHTTDGTGTGAFTSSLTNLNDYTTYYVRAYATNSIGTRYGEQKTFKTLYDGEGAIDGKFTVNSSGDQVYFSKGNLQYVNGTWKFAEHQWDYLGAYGETAWDLFGWSTSSTNYGMNTATSSSTYSGDFRDWGNNAISNGGNTTNTWRTLTKDEWEYVFNTRTTTSGIRYAKATVNGKAGVILLPDDWDSEYYSLSSTNTGNAAFTSNSISADDWTASLESHGAVFLPAAGYRNGTTVNFAGSYGIYWSSTAYNVASAYYLSFDSSNVNPSLINSRYYGYSVRLVVEL